mgnify:CR=1 FL=1
MMYNILPILPGIPTMGIAKAVVEHEKNRRDVLARHIGYNETQRVLSNYMYVLRTRTKRTLDGKMLYDICFREFCKWVKGE